MKGVMMNKKPKYSHVIWDWNGTLFNDVAWGIQTVNQLLYDRRLNTLNSLAEYHNVFGFPIVEYYKKVGFDLEAESFADIAEEYIRLYHSQNSGNCILFENAEKVLNEIQSHKIKQIILSASEINNLLSQLNEFDINSYFDEILGISDIYAKSKVEIGLDYIARKDVEKCIVIGDTQHDYEVSKALGADCLLICRGHQSKETLAKCGVPVLHDITEVIDYLG